MRFLRSEICDSANVNSGIPATDPVGISTASGLTRLEIRLTFGFQIDVSK